MPPPIIATMKMDMAIEPEQILMYSM